MHRVIYQKIHQADNILLTSHQNCPDAIGSMCVFIDFLATQNKKFSPFLAEAVPKKFEYLANAEKITNKKPCVEAYDLYITLDAGDLKQTTLENELGNIVTQQKNCVINIDHHKTNEGYGHINLVDKNASSTCEIIYLLLNKWKHDITPNTAECLLTGLVGDTGNFTNAATNEKALKISADLISRGANIFQIIQKLFSVQQSINALRLWGTIFERLTYNTKYDIAISYVLQKDLKDCNTSEESVRIVANLLNYIHGIKAGILLKQKQDGSFKASMRTNHPNIDLSILAKRLGGGGHKKAAGFSIQDLNNINFN